MVVEPPEIRPFQLKRKIRWGVSKNESKGGFLVGRARVCPRSRQGGASAILLEIGSNFSVQGSHENRQTFWSGVFHCLAVGIRAIDVLRQQNVSGVRRSERSEKVFTFFRE